jgi:hypothetical protein
MDVSKLARELILLLRFPAPPIVGVILVWLFDRDHDILEKALAAAGTTTAGLSTWSVVAYLVALGFAVYFAHRLLFYERIRRCMVRLVTKKFARSPKPTVHDLAFAQWRRRSCAETSAAKSTQSVLDEGNAGCHFFYCCFWATPLNAGFMATAFPENFSLAHVSGWFGVVLVAFFLMGLVGDYRMTKWDLEAYYEFPKDKVCVTNGGEIRK